MTDKLTAAGIKVPWPLTMYRRLTYMDASPELRLKWASKAIDALVDLLVQTTNELRLSNRMHAKLTDKHTEALMRAETADARIAELEAENERLKIEQREAVGWCCPYKHQVDRLRIRVEKAERALEALDD